MSYQTGWFIGMKMDDKSTNIIHNWLLKCQKESFGCFHPCPKQFLYIPVAYCCNQNLDPEVIKKSLITDFNLPITLKCCQTRELGPSRVNISLAFDEPFLKLRNQFWLTQGFKNKRKFVPRIPMTHSHYNFINMGWHKTLPIREVTLVEEFCTPFDHKDFMRQIREARQAA